jgi:hypothetical protein
MDTSRLLIPLDADETANNLGGTRVYHRLVRVVK